MQATQLIQSFAKQLTIARGIKITITDHSLHMEPEEWSDGMRYEDTSFITELIRGASQFCMYLERNYPKQYKQLLKSLDKPLTKFKY